MVPKSRSEIVLPALVALVTSLIVAFVAQGWSAGSSRAEDLRSVRLIAYSDLISATTSCDDKGGEVASQLAILGATKDDLSKESFDAFKKQILEELSSFNANQTACVAPLRNAAARVRLVTDDAGIADEADALVLASIDEFGKTAIAKPDAAVDKRYYQALGTFEVEARANAVDSRRSFASYAIHDPWPWLLSALLVISTTTTWFLSRKVRKGVVTKSGESVTPTA